MTPEQPFSRRVVIYHAKCIDGFTAAWATWTLYKDAAEYVPASYGEAPPDVDGADVLIVDFSYPRGVLEAMHRRARSLRVLDHHLTAKNDLEGLPYATFDMERSGAGLAWDHLHEGEPRPWLVDYVEDRDLWRFKLPYSREVNAFIGAHTRNSFDRWQGLSGMSVDHAVLYGSGILMHVDRYVEEMATLAALYDVDGHIVPVVNAPYINISEVVGQLCKGKPFAVGWYQGPGGMFFYSLRSRGGVDVSVMAKGLGGGGHKAAAGFISADPPWTLWTRAAGAP